MVNQYGLGVFNTKVTNKIAKVTLCGLLSHPVERNSIPWYSSQAKL